MFAKFLATTVVIGVTMMGVGSSHAATKKSCVMAGGEATMVTRGMAEFMANAALKNSIKAKELTASGPVNLKCNDPAPLTYCLAKQRACK